MVSTNSASDSHPLDQAVILEHRRLLTTLHRLVIEVSTRISLGRMGCTFAVFQRSRLKNLPKLEVLGAPGDAMTELFIARKDDQFFQLSKVLNKF